LKKNDKKLLLYKSLVKTLKVFFANLDFTRVGETFRVSEYGRKIKK